MAKKGGRPTGGRPPGNRGRGGVGPGPAYRPSKPYKGKGVKGGASGVATPPVVGIAFAVFIVAPVLLVGGIVAFIAHGNGAF